MPRLFLYFKIMRLPLVFTAIADVTAAYYLSTSGQGSWKIAIFLGMISAGLYTGGMVLNDLCDVKRDRELHPHRPFPQGSLSLLEGWLLFGLLTGGALGLTLLLESKYLPWALVTLGAVVFYDSLAKKWALTGILAMAMCRAGNFSLGAGEFHFLSVIIFAYTALLTGVSLLEEEWRDWKKVYVPVPLICGVILLGTSFFAPYRELALLGMAPVVVFLGWISWRLQKAESPPQIGKCVRDLILAFCILDAGLVLGWGGSLWGLGWWLYLVPAYLMMKLMGRH